MNYQKTIIGGHITRDIELKYTNNGTAVCETGIASNRKNGENQQVLFIDTVFWGKTAENVDKYLGKGDPILVEGHLELQQWKDKNTNENRQKIRLVCERMTMVGKKNNDKQSNQGSSNASNYQAPETEPDDDDDIPF